jgi:hypothetical protein
MAASDFAYYPAETPLHPNPVYCGFFEFDQESGRSHAQAGVIGDPILDTVISKLIQSPIRIQYEGAFLRRVGAQVVCNVDAELPEQPTAETIASILIEAMLSPENRAS